MSHNIDQESILVSDEKKIFNELTIVSDATPARPVLDIVIPVYNEEKDLPACIEKLTEFLARSITYSARITGANNASTDDTLEVGKQLAGANPEIVRLVHLNKKGRGRALHAVWATTDADVAVYMDVDLSTDLNGFKQLIAPLISGDADISIGSRLQKDSRVVRGVKREFISRCYNFILRTAMRANFSDAQCGFKAITTSVARKVLPLVRDTGWFFDTELLILSERIGLRINEVAVDWVDDPESKVNIISTATEDLKGCYRVARAIAKGELPIAQIREAIGRESFIAGVPSGMIGQIVRFAVIGVLSTVLQIVLFIFFRKYMNAIGANLLSLGISTIFNVVSNRSFTFGVHGENNALKQYSQGILIFVFTAVLTSGALSLLSEVDPEAGTAWEVGVYMTANIAATVVRFVAFRWIFHASRGRKKIEENTLCPEDVLAKNFLDNI